MTRTKRVGFFAGAAALTLTGVGFGENTPDASNDELKARVAQLERQLAELKANSGDSWLTEQRSAEIRSLVQDVLADADTRASLLQNGAGAGWDRHFFLGSQDGAFRLNIGVQAQFRYVFNSQDDEALAGDTSRGGFENSRTKAIFWGNIIDEHTTYKVQGNFDRDGEGDFGLEDAWINHDYDNGWGLKVGQFKAPLLREELVDSSMQQTVERSLVNSVFTADRVQGIMAHFMADQFRFSGAFHDGGRSANSSALSYDTEWAFTARGEFMLSGSSWELFDDHASWQGGETGTLLGAAAHYEKEEFGTALDGEIETLILTGDATLEFGGWNLFGAVVWSDFDSDTAVFDANPWGVVVQGGVFVAEDWELFGRFEWGDSDFEDSEELTVLTLGATKYFSGHASKWTTDFGYAFNPVDPFWGGSEDADLAGWESDFDPDADGQFVIRTQWQLLF
jgi:hypothetical protein